MRLLAALKTQIEFRRDRGRHQKAIWRLRPWATRSAPAWGSPKPEFSLDAGRGYSGALTPLQPPGYWGFSRSGGPALLQKLANGGPRGKPVPGKGTIQEGFRAEAGF